MPLSSQTGKSRLPLEYYSCWDGKYRVGRFLVTADVEELCNCAAYRPSKSKGSTECTGLLTVASPGRPARSGLQIVAKSCLWGRYVSERTVQVDTLVVTKWVPCTRH